MTRAVTHLALLGASVALGLAGALGTAFVLAPLPGGALDLSPVVSRRIEDRAGGLLREALSPADGRAVALAADELPPAVVAAFLAAEDRRFFEHRGVDPLAVLRAALQNVRSGRIVSGGSTLTQQLARRVFGRERTLAGKIAEALWAMRLEAHASKPELLAQYLNRVPMGNGVYGVEAAAQAYFGRRARHLSHAQAALLAALARGPSFYDPYRHLERARARAAWVLERMVATGGLAAAEAEAARSAPLDLRIGRAPFRAPHFVARVEAELDLAGVAPARVATTIDPELQAAVERIVAEELSGLASRNVRSAAAIVVDNPTGEILAYVGSVDFWDDAAEGQNDGVAMRRQPGSALKPFAYGLALARGSTPATLLSDVEIHLATPTGDYAPRNYDRRVHGPVRLRAALANSYNVPAVRLVESLGVDAVLEVLRRAGFESLEKGSGHYGVGVVLGNGEVSLAESARAYAGLARGGVRSALVAVRAAWGADGRPVALPASEPPVRFLPPEAAALVTHILADAPARAPAFGLDNALRLPFPVAAKTGTSKGYSDNWTLGFTRERTVAVWAGNFDGSPMEGVSGITGAAPIFRRTMLTAMRGFAPVALVADAALARATICPLSGARVGPACPSRMEEVFVPGTEPRGECPMHRALPVDRRTGDIASRCAGPGIDTRVRTDVGPAYYGWARAEGVAAGPWPAPACAPMPADEADRLVLASPADGDEYLLTDDVPPENQTIPVRVIAPRGVIRVIVETAAGDRLELAPPFWGRVRAVRGDGAVSVRRAGRPAPEAVARYRVRG